MESNIGKFLDSRYELLEVIGTGGMAVVYKARCHRLNRFVAVKVLKSDLAQDAEFRRRFHDESQAVAMLSHPNIVAVYDVSRSSDLDYIVMELIDGITLKQYMKKKGMQLNWREALHFITQIMRALSHAHSRGIIHRDIKPHNIMVLRDGSVKVADFGIARLVSAAQSTLTQEALGSVHYISPEQARGSHIDARADIYSAGVVLYEMTTGRLPFEGESAVSVAIAHINSIPLSPRELNPEIPEALEAITMKAMAPNVDQRYTGSDAMLADLEEFRKNPNINFDFTLADVAGHDPDEPTRRLARPPKSAVAAKGGAAVALDRDVRRTRRGREDAVIEVDYEEVERGSVWPVLLAVGSILVFLIGISYFLWITFFSGLFSTQADYRVPNLAGLTIEEAERHPDVVGVFEVVRGELVETAEYPAGEIVSQQPEADKVVKSSGLIITVNISAGAGETRMPEVKNWEQRMAYAILHDEMGLSVTQEQVFSDEVTMGYVVSSMPEADTLLLPGDEVTLFISKGPEIRKVMVPAFVGMSLEVVKTQLPTLELELGTVKEVPNDTQPVGYIVYQSIEQGTEVTVNSKVDFEVSTGVEEKPDDPDVTASTTPEPTTSTSPEPTPTTTTPVVVTTTKTVPVDLPDREGIVFVQITVGGGEQWKGHVDCSIAPTINPRVSGSGVQEVCIYIDSVLVKQYNLDFSS